MSPTILASVLSLAAALVWGTGDFTGGLSARRIGAFHALMVSFFFGLGSLVVVALVANEAQPATRDLLWGAGAGLLGMLGFLFMLRGFAIGRMSVVAPVSSVFAAVVPVIFAGFTVGLPKAIQLAGFVLAFVSIWLLSRRESEGTRPSGIGLALLGGLGFGLFFTALDQISEGAVFWPLVAGRGIAVVVMLAFALITRKPVVPKKSPMGLLALAGVLDVGGNLLFLLAVQTGRLDIAAVLVSLYPGVTVMLARFIAKESMSRMQVIAVGLAVLAIMLIAL